MRLTVDNATLITCTVDGTVCVWDVKCTKEKIMHANVKLADDTLVSAEYLSRKVGTVDDMTAEMRRLTKATADDVAAIERAHEKQLRALGEGRSAFLERMRKDRRVRTAKGCTAKKPPESRRT